MQSAHRAMLTAELGLNDPEDVFEKAGMVGLREGPLVAFEPGRGPPDGKNAAQNLASA